MTRYISLIDAPIVVRDGEVLAGQRIVVQSPQYGRVLFIEAVGMSVTGHNCCVRDCSIVFQGCVEV